jgi:Cdc6-like AAA superfamily ATPase
LWLHGIPGAGKTILASYIVQNTQRFCEDSNLSHTGWAYYYCYYGRNQEETHPLLCWIISQLCRQLKYIPEKLRMLRNRGTEPGYEDLLEVLSSLVTKFRRVYIVLDALDESQDRKFLLDLLIKIASDDAFEKVRLLAMSRKELDIQKAFEGKCSSISLSNSLVDEDIRVYIESQLQTDRKLSRWPDSLKRDIRNALVKGAKGM